MLFDPVLTPEETEPPESEIRVSFAYDWDTHQYQIDAGSPTEITGTDAVKAWLQQVIHTQCGRYPMYPPDYGTTIHDLIGHRYPKGFDLSEIRRQLTDSAKYCPAIEEIRSVIYDGDAIRCTVILADGAGKESFNLGL